MAIIESPATPAEVHARGGQHDLVELDVVVPLRDLRVLENRLECRECLIWVEVCVFCGRTHRQVVRDLRLPCEGVTHDRVAHRVQPGGFEVEDEGGYFLKVL